MSCCGGAVKKCVKNTSCINVIKNGRNLKGITGQMFKSNGKNWVPLTIFNGNNVIYSKIVSKNKIKNGVLNFSNLSNNNILNLEKIGHEELEKTRLIGNAFRKGVELSKNEIPQLKKNLLELYKNTGFNENSEPNENSELNKNNVNSTGKINRNPTSRDGGGASTSSNRRASTSSNRRASTSSNTIASIPRSGGGASTSRARESSSINNKNNKNSIFRNVSNKEELFFIKLQFEKIIKPSKVTFISMKNIKTFIEEIIKKNNIIILKFRDLLNKFTNESKKTILINTYKKLIKINNLLNKILVNINIGIIKLDRVQMYITSIGQVYDRLLRNINSI